LESYRNNSNITKPDVFIQIQLFINWLVDWFNKLLLHCSISFVNFYSIEKIDSVILASIMIQQLFGGPYTNPIDVENRILMI
jgi:hypothetical protein